MKRLSLLFALSIVLLSFGLANAVLFDVQMEAGKTFVHPVDLNTYYMGNTPMYLDIMLGGEAGTGELGGISETHIFYSPTGDNVIWGTAGAEIGGAMDLMNGFAGGTIWGMLNLVSSWNFDGTLPDTFNHSGISMGGMPDTDPLLARYRFYLTVPVTGHDVTTDVVEICVDSSGYAPDPTYDWIFPIKADFGGPFCFNFVGVPNLPPYTSGGPVALSVAHNVNFSGSFTLADAEGDAVTAVVALDESSNPIGSVTFGGGFSYSWTYNPPCSWVTDGLSHTVTFYAEDAVNGHAAPVTPGYTVSLDVTNSAPVIGGTGCGNSIVAGVGAATVAYFSATDVNGDAVDWSYVADEAPAGLVDLTGGVFTFTPVAADEFEGVLNDGFFTFTVTVTDCAGATSSCNVTYEVISELPFFIKLQQRLSTDNCPYAYLGQHAYVDVIQEQGSENNLGFDFLIAYDNSALAFMGAYGNPTLFDMGLGYEWEYFTYRFVNNCGGSCPSGLLQVVAIADQNDGFHHPLQTVLPEDFVLFTMDFMVTNDYTLECSFVPISFFWTDCTDNSIAMNKRSAPALEVVQAVSRNVFGYNGTYFPITDGTSGFPTFTGTQDDCLLVGEDKFNLPFIDFFNGGIKICCSDSIDARGDINLNGIANEIADAVVFTNYFIYGNAAFTINYQGQKAATDVNNDGIVLSVADLVYLIRVVVGDVLPIEKLNPNMVAANIVQDGQLVSVDVELGAALFVLEGNVEVNLAQGASHMSILSDVVDGNTRVLVYSFDQGATFSGNVLNTDGKMISVEAADYNGTALKTVVLPSSFMVKNFPNPFNPTTTIEMALPVATNWNLTIYNVAGQKVAEFSGFAEAGINNVVWDAASSASGIYFYKVTTDNGSMTKKMVLLN